MRLPFSSHLILRPSRRVRVPLFWRVFVTNAVVLAVATGALVLSPATVSFPVALTEAVVLGLGLVVMLGLNFALLRRALAPLEDLRASMRGADPLRPGIRAPVDAASPELREVAASFNEMVERLERERRESAGRALAAQERERLRTARELHDEVGQKLTALMLHLNGIPPAEAPVALERTREGLRETLEDVRGIARGLRPEALDDLGLVSALTALTNALERSAPVVITRRIDRAALPALKTEIELVVYRVAQEALTNVVRHAGCDMARLELEVHGAALELSVSDDGFGFDPATVVEGAGIRGMRERALLVGAALDLDSAPGIGTAVRLRVPLPQAQADAVTSS